MALKVIAIVLLAFVALYPIVTAGLWITGGLLFRLLDEHNDCSPPAGGWPGVTVLIPAYNEEAVVGRCVSAVLAVDYPELEALVLDDGSKDETAAAARAAGAGDPRLEVVRDPVNRGKAEQLNLGIRRARHDLFIVCDADTHLQPLAPKLLVSRLSRSERIAAVAGGPHVTNRRTLLAGLQILEAASIIGLIRRTQGLIGRVGVVAGVLGLFRRDAVLEVGGYNGRMATEDIDLSWRLLLAGWETTFEPAALVGMQVPVNLKALWAQRKRWARGQGEVLHTYLRRVARWRNRRLWPLVIEALASLAWVFGLTLALVLTTLDEIVGKPVALLGFGLAWGISIAVVATIQLSLALGIEHPYDRRAALAFFAGPLYPLAYWTIAAAAALRSEALAVFKGPREKRVVWDIPREGA
ncbi:MAG TPA: glycosyltransferase family 2 protein [Solirubrobacteraceae bacterium]|jgi:biofilm PGA synthesis N-glycosyltransferase PgaC